MLLEHEARDFLSYLSLPTLIILRNEIVNDIERKCAPCDDHERMYLKLIRHAIDGKEPKYLNELDNLTAVNLRSANMVDNFRHNLIKRHAAEVCKRDMRFLVYVSQHGHNVTLWENDNFADSYVVCIEDEFGEFDVIGAS